MLGTGILNDVNFVVFGKDVGVGMVLYKCTECVLGECVRGSKKQKCRYKRIAGLNSFTSKVLQENQSISNFGAMIDIVTSRSP